MKHPIDLWYPNYGNNPGVVSKLIKETVTSLFSDLGVKIHDAYYVDTEHFKLDISIDSPEYIEYITQQLHHKFGSINSLSQVSPGDVVVGRLLRPGKVGFGIFVDIGIRKPSQQDALLPLYTLRRQLVGEKLANREIVKLFGLTDQFPVPVKIVEKDISSGKNKIELEFTDEFVTMVESWKEQQQDILIITKIFTSKVYEAFQEKDLMNFTTSIESLDPLTTVVQLRKGTRAHGILPIIGPKLPRSPLGIFVGSK